MIVARVIEFNTQGQGRLYIQCQVAAEPSITTVAEGWLDPNGSNASIHEVLAEMCRAAVVAQGGTVANNEPVKLFGGVITIGS